MVREDSAPQSLQLAGFGCIRGGRVLLRHVDLMLNAGQVLLLKGSNGAGKSTLLRSLAGLLPWRAGQLSWCGREVQVRSAVYLQHLSYLGHQCGMSDALTGMENLRFALNLLNVTWQPHKVAAVLGQLGMCEWAHQPFGRLSQGQRRRLAIARIMLSERPLWLLDEPDSALDCNGEILLAQILEAHATAGGMAIVATHRGITLSSTPTLVLDLSAAALPIPAQGVAC